MDGAPPTHWQPLPAPPGSGDGPPPTSELEKAWRDGYETHVSGARNIEKAWADSRYAKTAAVAGAVPPLARDWRVTADELIEETRQSEHVTAADRQVIVGAVPPPEEPQNG